MRSAFLRVRNFAGNKDPLSVHGSKNRCGSTSVGVRVRSPHSALARAVIDDVIDRQRMSGRGGRLCQS